MKDFSITVSGLTSCGKTSYAKQLEKTFNLTRISASNLLLDVSLSMGYNGFQQKERHSHFWLKSKAENFNKQRLDKLELDMIVDNKMLELIKTKKGLILETLSTPFLIDSYSAKNVLSIYFDISFETRVKRAFIFSKTININDLRKLISNKDFISQSILKKIWGINIFDTDSINNNNDIIIDNSIFNELENDEIILFEKERTTKLLISLIRLYIISREIKKGLNITDKEIEKHKQIIGESMFLIKKLPVSIKELL